MDSVAADTHGEDSALIDVTELPLPSLLAAGNSVLDNALLRLLDDLDKSKDISAGFSNRAGSS